MTFIESIHQPAEFDKVPETGLGFQFAQPGELILWRDPVPYPDAWNFQQRLHAERLSEVRPDTLLLLEHQPVFTVGRSTQPAHLLAGEAALSRTGAISYHVNRGGSVTYHGPGQLVGYPILKLSRYVSGPKAYVRLLEDMLIMVLAAWKIEGCRIDEAPGVWAQADGELAKVASIGVRVDHGVTLHGFALNVDLDLAPFSHIVPCGLTGRRTTSMSAISQSSVPIRMVAGQVAACFGSLFRINWTSRRDGILEEG